MDNDWVYFCDLSMIDFLNTFSELLYELCQICQMIQLGFNQDLLNKSHREDLWTKRDKVSFSSDGIFFKQPVSLTT